MSAPHCCQRTPRAWRVRIREVAGLILPGALLALMPKCPMCLAAYVALGTGFTMSFSSAYFVMRLLTALSISVLAFCVARRMMKHVHLTQPFHFQTPNLLR